MNACRNRIVTIARRQRLLLGCLALWMATLCQPAWAESPKQVIAISVDGLGSSYLQTIVDKGQAPNFKRFQTEAPGPTTPETITTSP